MVGRISQARPHPHPGNLWLCNLLWQRDLADMMKAAEIRTLSWSIWIDPRFSSVQLLSRVRLFATPWITAHQASPVHHKLPEFTQTHVHPVSDTIQPSHPLSSPSPPVPNPSQHEGLFQWVNSSHEVAKYWSFSISPSNEHPGLISFRMDWLDLLAVRGTLKSLLQHHSSKASIFQRSAFFTVQLSYPYMTTGKTIALTRQTSHTKKRD